MSVFFLQKGKTLKPSGVQGLLGGKCKKPQRFSASKGSQFLLAKQVQPKISSRNKQLNVLKHLRKKHKLTLLHECLTGLLKSNSLFLCSLGDQQCEEPKNQPRLCSSILYNQYCCFSVLPSSACGSEEQLLEYQPHCPPTLRL